MLKTLKSKLPYKFEPDVLAKRVHIQNTKGQTLSLTLEEVARQLSRDDLDVHRRRIYEEAQRVLTQAKAKAQP